MNKIKALNGPFSGRTYLTDNEWEVFTRVLPVRYLDKKFKKDYCEVCGEKGGVLQLAHKIPFSKGIRQFQLTPDLLNSPDNLITAHQGKCNKSVEWSAEEILEYLNYHG